MYSALRNPGRNHSFLFQSYLKKLRLFSYQSWRKILAKQITVKSNPEIWHIGTSLHPVTWHNFLYLIDVCNCLLTDASWYWIYHQKWVVTSNKLYKVILAKRSALNRERKIHSIPQSFLVNNPSCVVSKHLAKSLLIWGSDRKFSGCWCFGYILQLSVKSLMRELCFGYSWCIEK